jgi:hypothetical protein
LSRAIAKLASINLQKLVLSPTGSINLGFILREDLLLCSPYCPLRVPNWADIYTPSRGSSKVPRKVVWYFPSTPCLKRYFVDPKEVKLMQWHAEREKPRDDPEKGTILTHPTDASQWLALDMEDGFGDDARNVRLGMSTNGLNPFGNQSSTHSTWPIFVWPYNLPPGCAPRRDTYT